MTTISGSSPPSRPNMTSTMCSESRIVPDTTFAPRPTPWSLIVFSQVTPRSRPEELPVGAGERGRDRDDEPHPVDRGDHPAAPHLRQREPGLAGDQGKVRRGDSLGPEVVLEHVRQPRPLQRRHAGLGDRPVPDVHRVRRQARGDRGAQVLQPGPATGHGGERRSQRRVPRHHLQDDFGQVDAGQHRRGPVAQVHQRRRLLHRLHPGEVDLPCIVHPYLGVSGQAAADVPVGRVQRAVWSASSASGSSGRPSVVSTSGRTASHAGPSTARPAGCATWSRRRRRSPGASEPARTAPARRRCRRAGSPPRPHARDDRTPAASTGHSPRHARSCGPGSAGRSACCGGQHVRQPLHRREHRAPSAFAPNSITPGSSFKNPTTGRTGRPAQSASRPGRPRQRAGRCR